MKTAVNRGFAILELLVALGLVSIVSLALFATMSYALTAWRSTESRQAALAQLNLASNSLIKDLAGTDKNQLLSATVPGLSGHQGDALWFLSAYEPGADDRFVRSRETGKPIWQTNVLYYLIQPQNHSTISNGVVCNAVDGGGGYDSGCPHKVLVRKVVDLVAQPDPLDEANQEVLMTPGQAAAQLTAPLGFSTSNLLAEPGVVPEGATLAGRDLLWFRVTRDVPAPGVTTLDLRTVRIDEARREVPVGTVNLLQTKHTLQHQLELSPNN